jgi:Plavaka transposase
MPVKCSFCRRRYSRAGAYETHLRTAHANLDIVLASTIRHPSTDNTDHTPAKDQDTNDRYAPPDSDYESETATEPFEPAGDTLSGKPNCDTSTETVNVTSDAVTHPTHYVGAGQAVGDVKGYDEDISHLCENPWNPFTCGQGFKLASWFIESKVPKSRINEYFTNQLGNSDSVGYSSMHTLENFLRRLDPHGPYLQWFEGQAEDDQRTLPFFYRNILDCVRYLLRQIAYRDDLVYAPRREYDQDGQRIYAEMHTADWWWDVQVSFLILFSMKHYSHIKGNTSARGDSCSDHWDV